MSILPEIGDPAFVRNTVIGAAGILGWLIGTWRDKRDQRMAGVTFRLAVADQALTLLSAVLSYLLTAVTLNELHQWTLGAAVFAGYGVQSLTTKFMGEKPLGKPGADPDPPL